MFSWHIIKTHTHPSFLTNALVYGAVHSGWHIRVNTPASAFQIFVISQNSLLETRLPLSVEKIYARSHEYGNSFIVSDRSCSTSNIRLQESEEEDGEKKKKKHISWLGFYFIVLNFISLATLTLQAVMILLLNKPGLAHRHWHRANSPFTLDESALKRSIL